MTYKQQPEEAKRLGRAVWLARLPAGLPQHHADHRDRRSQATKLTRARSADTIGEFLISSGEGENLPDRVWDEVLDFIRHVHADLLIVLRPDEISPSLADDYRRTAMLEAARMGLSLYEADGANTKAEEPLAA